MQVGAQTREGHTLLSAERLSAACNTHFTICVTCPLVRMGFQSGPTYLADRKLFKSSTMEYIYFGLRHPGADSPLMASHSCSTLARERMLLQFVKHNYGIFFLTGKEKHRSSTMSTVFLSECSDIRVD